jgi:drug/metabolite transporter (DMT)-like permease
MKKHLSFAFIAALLAGLNVPLSIFLLKFGAQPIFLAGWTYLASGLALGLLFLILKLSKHELGPSLRGIDWLYVGLINLLDGTANVLLFLGLQRLNGETASLLQSFEVVATAVVALLLFKEKISWRLGLAILIVVGASVLLSFNPAENFAFEPAALYILGTTLCWGFTNNLAKKLSGKDPVEYGMVKGLIPGIVLVVVALFLGQGSTDYRVYLIGLLDGAFAYGLSIVFLVLSFRKLSASLGTAIYASNPFLGALFALLFFPHWPTWNFYVALALLILGEGLAALDGFLSERKTLTAPSSPD